MSDIIHMKAVAYCWVSEFLFYDPDGFPGILYKTHATLITRCATNFDSFEFPLKGVGQLPLHLEVASMWSKDSEAK